MLSIADAEAAMAAYRKLQFAYHKSPVTETADAYGAIEDAAVSFMDEHAAALLAAAKQGAELRALCEKMVSAMDEEDFNAYPIACDEVERFVRGLKGATDA